MILTPYCFIDSHLEMVNDRIKAEWKVEHALLQMFWLLTLLRSCWMYDAVA